MVLACLICFNTAPLYSWHRFMTDKPQIHFIQALRAIAAMMVLVWHFKPKGEHASPVLDFFFTNGFAGVDLFFVISGFIMVYTTGGRDGGARQALLFMAKRFARIWPLYAFGTALYVSFLIALDWMTKGDFIKTGLSLIFYPVSPSPTLDVGWTLNIEMYFYLVFAACILFDRLRWTMAGLWIISTLIVQSSITSFAFVPDSLGFMVPVLAQAVHPCIPEFFAGMIIAAFFMSGIRINKSLGFPLAALLIAFSAWQYIDGFYNKPGIYGMGASAIAIVLGFSLAEKTGFGWKPSPLLIWMGNISFSIYIIHTTVGLSLTRVLMKTSLSEYVSGVGYLVFLTVLILALSAITYELIEKRLSSSVARFLGISPEKQRSSEVEFSPNRIKERCAE